MSLTDVLIMVVGAALGYLVVSSLMSKPQSKSAEPVEPALPAPPPTDRPDPPP